MDLKEARYRLDQCLCGMGVIEHYGFYTSFMNDFKIADAFGTKAIKDTYSRAFKEWKKDIIYMTELYLVMAWRGDYHYSQKNKGYADLYYGYKRELDDYIFKHFKGEELQYFIRFTD